MNTTDPRMIVDNSPISRFQLIAISLCVLLNALDGFDVLSISFAAPGIASEWNINRATLGIVLSIELIGMAVGSLILGNVADAIGRRPTALLCLLVMAIGMGLAGTASDVTSLSVYRFITGLGIGGVLACINALAAEYSNRKRRAMTVTIMAAGYPLGAIVGGSIASALLAHFDWRSVFFFGATATAVCIPLCLMFLPESIEHLVQKRPNNALTKVNKTLRRMGRDEVSELPQKTAGMHSRGFGRLFSSDLIRLTILLTIAYFAHIMTFYFIIKWIPKIVVDMGFSASLAGSVLVWANVGGATGAILFSGLTQKFAVRVLVMGAMIIGAIMVSIFGSGQDSLAQLSLIAATAGIFTNSAIVGLYALMAQSFPVEVRAGGTGFVIGIGRGGSALGPIVAGFLFEAGFGLQGVAILMALGSVVGAVALFFLPSATKSAFAKVDA